MKWTLYRSGTSPFVRMVEATLIELNLADQVARENVVASPGKTPAELSAVNPIGKIPTLLREDGPALYDSRVICRYLAAQSDAEHLYPEDQLWEVLTLEATAHAVCEAAVATLYEKRFHEEERRSEVFLDGQAEKIRSALGTIEKRWMSHLHGPFSMAHLTIIAALDYLSLRKPIGEWQSEFPKLAEWLSGHAERPAMKATIPSE